MTLKDIQSDKLLFDIHAENLVEKFKEKFIEFQLYEGKVDPHKVCQYMVLMCDMFSPMQTEKADLYQRKYACAVMVKFPMSKKVFSKEAEDILLGSNDVINQTMVAYIASYGQPNYTLLQAFMALMSFETQKVFSGQTGKDSAKTINDVSVRIQSLTRDFFKSGDYDEASVLRQVLYSRIEKERLRLRPEQIIRYLEDEGELPEDFNPYGDYKIELKEDLQFIGDHAPKK